MTIFVGRFWYNCPAARSALKITNASCYTCYPKVLFAFAFSASSPTGDGGRSWLNANSSSLRLPETPSRPSPTEPTSTWLCPLCGGTMVVIERLTAQQVADRTTELPGYVDTS